MWKTKNLGEYLHDLGVCNYERKTWQIGLHQNEKLLIKRHKRILKNKVQIRRRMCSTYISDLRHV